MDNGLSDSHISKPPLFSLSSAEKVKYPWLIKILRSVKFIVLFIWLISASLHHYEFLFLCPYILALPLQDQHKEVSKN